MKRIIPAALALSFINDLLVGAQPPRRLPTLFIIGDSTANNLQNVRVINGCLLTGQ